MKSSILTRRNVFLLRRVRKTRNLANLSKSCDEVFNQLLHGGKSGDELYASVCMQVCLCWYFSFEFSQTVFCCREWLIWETDTSTQPKEFFRLHLVELFLHGLWGLITIAIIMNSFISLNFLAAKRSISVLCSCNFLMWVVYYLLTVTYIVFLSKSCSGGWNCSYCTSHSN